MTRTKIMTIFSGRSSSPVLVMAFVGIVGGVLVITGCGPNPDVLRSNSPTPTPVSIGQPANSTPAADTVEKEVAAMQTADFNYIFVLRRRDGGVIDQDDKSFLRQTTSNVNRRSLSDDGKAIIIGSNAKFPPELLDAIKQRFALEDHSKPESE